MDPQKTFSADLIKIINEAMNDKMYGSIEVYFEAGNVTQITQRIINKVDKKTAKISRKKA